MKERAIVRTDEYGSYEIWFIDAHDSRWWKVLVYGAIAERKVRRLSAHCHTAGTLDYYHAKTKMVRKPLAQAVLNLYEKKFNCKDQYRLVMRWRKL